MHPTALEAGTAFAKAYGHPGKVVVDIGGQDVNGSLRDSFESREMKYICVDMVKHPSVDIVVPPGEKLPFEDNSVDLIVSTSCFEHDPCFWITFREMCRIIKKDGYIYVNAPSGGLYHGSRGDNWRFYSDAGQALAFWSGKQLSNEVVFPVKVIESFHMNQSYWKDWVCIWQRTEIPETSITISSEVLNTIGNAQKNVSSSFSTCARYSP
jgi:predicted SAM-dependent methyltransferase